MKPRWVNAFVSPCTCKLCTDNPAKGRKKCGICGERSLRGFKPGIGFCRYHCDVSACGAKWANKVHKRDTQ
jgi:hypothetical protein